MTQFECCNKLITFPTLKNNREKFVTPSNGAIAYFSNQGKHLFMLAVKLWK